MKVASLVLTLMLFVSIPAAADELQVIISGKAMHMGQTNQNEKNYGLGLQYDFQPYRLWIPLLNMASFKDSNNNMSKYIGAGIKRRYRVRSDRQRLNFDIGVAGLVMERPEYNNNDPFIGAIPFVSLIDEWGGVNATYVPSFEKNMLSFWYVQFSLKLMKI